MKNRKTFACRKSGGIVLGYREKFEGDIEVIETEVHNNSEPRC
jgi:hypothetical protein